MSETLESPPTPSVGMLQRFCRTLPGYTGLGRIANSRLLRGRAPADGIQLTQLWDGSAIFLKPNDLLSRVIYYFGDFDRKLSWICRRALRQGDTVIDIGANVGVISLPCARIVGPSGAVHSFEPQPELAGLLRRSAAANRYDWLHVHELALSDADGEAELWVPTGSSDGYATLHRDGDYPARAVKVPLRHSGDYLKSLQLDAVRLLKIDVEGHEVPILSGAREFLDAKRPDVVLF
jgi:FkbM family methyltransferase